MFLGLQEVMLSLKTMDPVDTHEAKEPRVTKLGRATYKFINVSKGEKNGTEHVSRP